MSDRLAMRTAIKRRLGNRTDVTTADADRFLDEGMYDVATRRFHFQELEAKATTITSQVGVSSYSKPAGSFALLYLVDTVNGHVLDRFDGTFEEFLRAKQVENPSTTDYSTRFVEYGNLFYVSITPQVATITWDPYVYLRPTWAAGDSAEPSIPVEWHYAIQLIAFLHGARELGDEERAGIAVSEWQEWLAQRDTSRKMTARFNTPLRGVGPHPRLRNRRTGV